MKTGSHRVIIGGAPARVMAYSGNLIVEVVVNHNVTDEEGLLFFWDSVEIHLLDITMLPSNVEIALISNDGQMLEVHDPSDEPVAPRYPFVSAAIMPRGWFDKYCTGSRCSMNLK